jgi:hypothetical protein
METIINRFAGGGRGLPGIQNHLVSNYTNDRRAPLNSLGFILNTFNINDIVALSSTGNEGGFARANIDGIYGNGDTLVAEALLPSLNRVASHVPMGLQSLDHKYWFYYDPHRHCNILQFQGTVDELVDSLANVSTNTLTHRLTSTDMVDFISEYFSSEEGANMLSTRRINYTFNRGGKSVAVIGGQASPSKDAMTTLYALQFISDMKSMGALDDVYKHNIYSNINNETFMLQSILPYNIHTGAVDRSGESKYSPYKHTPNPNYLPVLYAVKFAIFSALLVKLGLHKADISPDNMQLIKDFPLFTDKAILNMTLSTMSYLNTFSIQFIPQILADTQTSLGSMFSAVRAKEIYETNEKRVKVSPPGDSSGVAAADGESSGVATPPSAGNDDQTGNEGFTNTNKSSGDWLSDFNIIISHQLSKTMVFDMSGKIIVDKAETLGNVNSVYNLFRTNFNKPGCQQLPDNHKDFETSYSNILGKLILDTANTNTFTNYCFKPDNIIATPFDIGTGVNYYTLGTDEFYKHDILNLKSGLMERARAKSKVLINRKRLHSGSKVNPHSDTWDIAIANHKTRRRLMNGGLGRRLGAEESHGGARFTVKIEVEAERKTLLDLYNKTEFAREVARRSAETEWGDAPDEAVVPTDEDLLTFDRTIGKQPLYTLAAGASEGANRSFMRRGEEKDARDYSERIRRGPESDAIKGKVAQVASGAWSAIKYGAVALAAATAPAEHPDPGAAAEAEAIRRRTPRLSSLIDAYGEGDIELFPWKQFYREEKKWPAYKKQLSDMYQKMGRDVRYEYNMKCMNAIFKSVDSELETSFHFCDKIIWSMANGRDVNFGDGSGTWTDAAVKKIMTFFKSIISPDYDIITPDQLLEYLKQPHCDKGLSKYSIMESIDNLLPADANKPSASGSKRASFINAIHSVKITNNSDSKGSFYTDVVIELAPTYEFVRETSVDEVNNFFSDARHKVINAIKNVPMHTGCSPDNGIASELIFNTLILGKYDDANYTVDSTAAAFKSLEDYIDVTSLPRIDSNTTDKHAVMYTSYSKAIEEYSKIFGHAGAPKLAVTGHSMGGGYSSTFGYMCVYKLITLRNDPSIFKELLDITAPMKVHSWAPPRSFNPTTTVFMDTVDKIFDFKTNTPSNMMQKTVVNISNKHDPIYKIPWINQHIGANIIIDESITNRPGMLLSHTVEEIDAIQKQLQFQKEHGALMGEHKATVAMHKGAAAEAVAAAVAEAAAEAAEAASATSVIEAKHYIVMPTKQETTVKLEECHKKYIYEKCGEYLTWKLCEVKEYLDGFKTNEWILKSREESKVEQCSKEYLISMIGKILTILHVRCNDTPGTIKADIINLKKCYYRHNGLDIGGSVNLEVLKNSLDTIITHLKDNMKQTHDALTVYKNLYGDLQVPNEFVVPSEEPWPEAWRGREGLGNRVRASELRLDDATPSRVSIYKNVHRNDALFNSQLWSIQSNKFFAHKSTLISNTPLQCLQIDTDISTERVTITGDIRKKKMLQKQECEDNAYMINAPGASSAAADDATDAEDVRVMQNIHVEKLRKEKELHCDSGIITHANNRRLDEFAGWIGGDYSVEKQFIERCIVRDIQIDPVEWKYLVPKDVTRLEGSISHHPYQTTAVRDATAVNEIARPSPVEARGEDEKRAYRIDDEIAMSDRLLDTTSPAPPINWTDNLRTKLVSELDINDSAAATAVTGTAAAQAKELLCLVEDKHIEYNNIVSLIPSRAYGRDYSYTAGGQHATPSYLMAAYKFNEYNGIHKACKQAHKAIADLSPWCKLADKKHAGHLDIFNNISLKDIMFSKSTTPGDASQQQGTADDGADDRSSWRKAVVKIAAVNAFLRDISLENILKSVYTGLESKEGEPRPKTITYDPPENSIIITYIKGRTKTYKFKGINCNISQAKHMISFEDIKRLVTPTLEQSASWSELVVPTLGDAHRAAVYDARASEEKAQQEHDTWDNTLKWKQKWEADNQTPANLLMRYAAAAANTVTQMAGVTLGQQAKKEAEAAALVTKVSEASGVLEKQKDIRITLERELLVDQVKSLAVMSTVFQIATDVLASVPKTPEEFDEIKNGYTKQENMDKFLTNRKTIHYGTSSYYSLIQLIRLINDMLSKYNNALDKESNADDGNHAREREGNKRLNTATVKDSTIYANQLIGFIKLVITPGNSSPESAAILVNTDGCDIGDILMV